MNKKRLADLATDVAKTVIGSLILTALYGIGHWVRSGVPFRQWATVSRLELVLIVFIGVFGWVLAGVALWRILMQPPTVMELRANEAEYLHILYSTLPNGTYLESLAKALDVASPALEPITKRLEKLKWISLRGTNNPVADLTDAGKAYCQDHGLDRKPR
jgi:hypothetical protein